MSKKQIAIRVVGHNDDSISKLQEALASGYILKDKTLFEQSTLKPVCVYILETQQSNEPIKSNLQ